jgi:hypothetical protein
MNYVAVVPARDADAVPDKEDRRTGGRGRRGRGEMKFWKGD